MMQSIDDLLYKYQIECADYYSPTKKVYDMERFHQLFTADAIIDEEDVLPYVKDKKLKPSPKYVFFHTVVNSYIRDAVKKNYKSLNMVINHINMDYDSIRYGKAKAIVSRSFWGELSDAIQQAYPNKLNSLNIRNSDSIRLHIILSENGRLAQIEKVELLKSNFECKYCDFDNDGIADAKDKTPSGGTPNKDISTANPNPINPVADRKPTTTSTPPHQASPSTNKPTSPKSGLDPTQNVVTTKPKAISDSDHDGVEDKMDKCPDYPCPMGQKGCMLGCVDSDNDGIEDIKDMCPNDPCLFGSKGCTFGCVDKDEDGVIDTKDKCPTKHCPQNVAGCVEGCPTYGH